MFGVESNAFVWKKLYTKLCTETQQVVTPELDIKVQHYFVERLLIDWNLRQTLFGAELIVRVLSGREKTNNLRTDFLNVRNCICTWYYGSFGSYSQIMPECWLRTLSTFYNQHHSIAEMSVCTFDTKKSAMFAFTILIKSPERPSRMRLYSFCATFESF